MSAFTSRLTDSVRLVGSTISCEGSPLHGQRKGEWRRNPHVQSYAVATDAVRRAGPAGSCCSSGAVTAALSAATLTLPTTLPPPAAGAARCCCCVRLAAQAGLQLLIADAAVFGCHKDRWDTIFYSELGSSKAILDAGFNIDCLMLRYQGVDWRDRANWNCNGR